MSAVYDLNKVFYHDATSLVRLPQTYDHTSQSCVLLKSLF